MGPNGATPSTERGIWCCADQSGFLLDRWYAGVFMSSCLLAYLSPEIFDSKGKKGNLAQKLEVIISFLGGNDGLNSMATTELFVHGHIVTGPELPYAVENPCMIRINETHSMLTGGYSSDYYAKKVSNHDNSLSERLAIELSLIHI